MAGWSDPDRDYNQPLPVPAPPPLTSRPAFVPVMAALVALIVGSIATTYYAGQDLTLSHYDAKAHLVVARRIFDSLTPGWRQIGAVWLPLPHVLNAIPVQVDAWYRTGLSGVVISMLSFAAAAASLTWLVARLSGSLPAAWVTLAVFVYQPDLLYLQATPMTEPLLLGLTVTGIALLYAWTTTRGTGAAWPAGLVLALACLTRYEAWPMTVAAGLVAWLTLLRNRVGFGQIACRDDARRPVAARCARPVPDPEQGHRRCVARDGGLLRAEQPRLSRAGEGARAGRLGPRPCRRLARRLGGRRRRRRGAAPGTGPEGPPGLVVRARAGRLRGAALLRVRERPPVPDPLHDPAHHRSGGVHRHAGRAAAEGRTARRCCCSCSACSRSSDGHSG